MIPLIRRQEATQATLERFDGKVLSYGSNDCVRMVSHHVRNLGGRVSILKGRRYSSALQGARVLKSLGFADLATAVDSLGWPRISPASALIGDVMALPADGPFGQALMVAAGNGRAFGLLRDENIGAPRFGVVQPFLFVTAWRVL